MVFFKVSSDFYRFIWIFNRKSNFTHSSEFFIFLTKHLGQNWNQMHPNFRNTPKPKNSFKNFYYFHSGNVRKIPTRAFGWKISARFFQLCTPKSFVEYLGNLVRKAVTQKRRVINFPQDRLREPNYAHWENRKAYKNVSVGVEERAGDPSFCSSLAKF